MVSSPDFQKVCILKSPRTYIIYNAFIVVDVVVAF